MDTRYRSKGKRRSVTRSVDPISEELWLHSFMKFDVPMTCFGMFRILLVSYCREQQRDDDWSPSGQWLFRNRARCWRIPFMMTIWWWFPTGSNYLWRDFTSIDSWRESCRANLLCLEWMSFCWWQEGESCLKYEKSFFWTLLSFSGL